MAQRVDVIAALTELEDSRGGLTPDLVLETARDPTSPLHQCFEWDDTVAAHRYRVDQARYLITSHRVEVIYGKVTLACPSYIRDPAMPVHEQGYLNIFRLRTDEELAHEALHQEMEQVSARLARAKVIAVMLDQLDTVEELERRVAAFREELRQARERRAQAEADLRAAEAEAEAETEVTPEPEPVPPTRPRGRWKRKPRSEARK